MRVRAAVALLTVATGLGCRDVLGIDDRSEGGSGGSGTTSSTGTAGDDPSVNRCNLAIFSTSPTPSCATCLGSGVTSCCTEIDACAADPACRSCLSADGTCPAPPPTLDALSACVRGSCSDVCYPTPPVAPAVRTAPGDLASGDDSCVPQSAAVTCSPMVPSATCGWESGTTCDVYPRNTLPGASGFACYLSARRHVGESCGLVEGMCHFGLTCANYRCARMCCTDVDCGAGGECDPAWFDYKFGRPTGSSDLGICVDP